MKFEIFEVNKEYKNIYYFLKDNGFSENYVSNLRKAWGNFVVNDEIVNIRKELKIGDTLKINSNPNTKTSIMQCIIPLDVVYEDEYYLLINKPSGISTMPNKSHYSHNLAGAICAYMEKKDSNFVLRVANRLDKDTSGLVIVAKDSIALNKLKQVEKTYYAICERIIENDIIIDKKILTVKNNGMNSLKRIISPLGQEAKTFVHPIKNDGKFTLIKVQLEHGRTHQIRVHLSHIGHPLIGDSVYGTISEHIARTALHCKSVSFFHSYLNKTLTFDTKLPEDFFIEE